MGPNGSSVTILEWSGGLSMMVGETKNPGFTLSLMPPRAGIQPSFSMSFMKLCTLSNWARFWRGPMKVSGSVPGPTLRDLVYAVRADRKVV